MTGLATLGRLIRLFAFGLVALIAGAGLSARPQDSAPLADVLRAKFASDLEAVARQADGVVGYVVIDVESGERMARLEDRQFPTASTIKLAILYELLRQTDEGRVSLDAVTPMAGASTVSRARSMALRARASMGSPSATTPAR